MSRTKVMPMEGLVKLYDGGHYINLRYVERAYTDDDTGYAYIKQVGKDEWERLSCDAINWDRFSVELASLEDDDEGSSPTRPPIVLNR
jgi:hypothetical protein